MKNLLKKISLVLAAGLMSMSAMAQKETDKIKIRVEKNVNGKVEVIEKEIDATGMSEEERQQVMESFQDSLFGDMKGQKKLKITMEEDREIDKDFDIEIEDEDFSWNFDDRHSPEVRVYKKKRKGANDEWDEFRWEMDRFGNEMRMLGEDIPRRLEKHLPRVYAWTDDVLTDIAGANIKSLDVFPNKPDSEIVNVRFYAPEEGDVNITILDTKGTIVAKKEAKNFKGEYVGQLELKKASKGTYFVIVSQGDDGVTRRVVID